MSIGISIDSKHLRALQKSITQKLNWSKILKSIAFEVEQATKQRFRLAETPDGQRWVAVSAKTKRQYQRQRKWLGSTLFRSGMMMQGISSSANNSQGRVFLSSPSARRHQLGGGGTPARPYLGIGSREQKSMDGVLAFYVKQYKQRIK